MITSSGLRQPAFIGISSSTSVRNTYSTAACTRRARVEVGGQLRQGAREIEHGAARLAVDPILTRIAAPLSIS